MVTAERFPADSPLARSYGACPGGALTGGMEILECKRVQLVIDSRVDDHCGQLRDSWKCLIGSFRALGDTTG